ncbi:hypothetical protein DV701_07260 [Ornithinimicrobium avium]|uniref:Uncharacterized protein n=2 Tax=Ornithinimicrobium avium TaxID=2283195 RepID=A0A345NLP3_9MICO|nr:hypothetical protein DV701_07260 [Ornithinimicrobium avium]
MDRANVLARGLLYEAPHLDGRAMLQAWGEVVEGASELWRQLPQRSDLPGSGRQVIDQLERSARTLHRSAGGGIDVDPTLQEIGQMFTEAGELITRSGVAERREPDRWTDAQLRDSFAARVNIMHTLYVASHAVSVGLAQTALAEQFDPRLRVHRVTAEELRHQVLGIEEITYSYIKGHYPQALDGRHREPTDDTRIPGAIAAWDVHAQRALTREPTTHAMTRVAGAAFSASVHVHALWRAAVQTGHVDPWTFDNEISPALETMIETWGEAHTYFQQLTHHQDSSPLALSRAGWELADAMREVTATGRMPASVQDMSDRVDGESLVKSLHRFHATLTGVAGVFHDATRNAPLLVDARVANDILRATPEDNGPGTPPVPDATVAPRDVLHKRAIPLPRTIRGRAEEIGRQATMATRAAMRSTLAASDGKPDAMSLPASWTRPVETAGRLSNGRRYERLGAAGGKVRAITGQVPG